MRSIVIAAALLAAPAHAATNEPDGTLLGSEPCPPNPVRSYEAFVSSVRAELNSEAAYAQQERIVMPAISDARLRASLPPREQVQDHLAYQGFECAVITYASGGLKVAGLLWKPKDTQGKHLPLLIALRGGNGAFGPMEPWRYWGWHDFLKAGYVVMSSQYRGGPGSEGTDTYASQEDLNDVRNLVPLAKSLGYVDTTQIFAHGGSRGGMELYMLAHSGLPLRVMAIRGGVSNLRRNFALRPGMDEMTSLMTDYATNPEAALDRRSAALWAEQIRVPTIIFHGTDDWRVTVQDALDVANGLNKGGTAFEMHLYGGDTHSIDLNQADMIRRTIEFFDRYRQP